jgi:hypothetical protein
MMLLVQDRKRVLVLLQRDDDNDNGRERANAERFRVLARYWTSARS